MVSHPQVEDLELLNYKSSDQSPCHLKIIKFILNLDIDHTFHFPPLSHPHLR